jgi:hypothetical protein
MTSIIALQEFILRFQVLFVSLGVPILTMLITWFVSVQTNRSGRRLAERERALSVQLKLAEFRQEWINGLREDLAAYAAATFPNDSGMAPKENIAQIVALGARIMMRMNPQDPDYSDFQLALSHALPSNEEQKKAAKEGTTVVAIGQRILKREWERLKEDLLISSGGSTP